jgi:hypothetical protein
VETSSCVHFETLMILVAMGICHYRLASDAFGEGSLKVAMEHCKRALSHFTHAETAVLPEWTKSAGAPTTPQTPEFWSLLRGATRGLCTKIFIQASQVKLAGKDSTLIKLHMSCARDFEGAYGAARALGCPAGMSDNIGRAQRFHQAYAWYLVAIGQFTVEPALPINFAYAFLAIQNAMELAASLLSEASGGAGTALYDAISEKHGVYHSTFTSRCDGGMRPPSADEWLASGAMQECAGFQHTCTAIPFEEPNATTLPTLVLGK